MTSAYLVISQRTAPQTAIWEPVRWDCPARSSRSLHRQEGCADVIPNDPMIRCPECGRKKPQGGCARITHPLTGQTRTYCNDCASAVSNRNRAEYDAAQESE